MRKETSRALSLSMCPWAMRLTYRRCAALAAAVLTVIALLAGCGSESATTSADADGDGFDAERAFADLEAQVELGPRPAGSPAGRRTAALLAARLREAGVEDVVGAATVAQRRRHDPRARARHGRRRRPLRHQGRRRAASRAPTTAPRGRRRARAGARAAAAAAGTLGRPRPLRRRGGPRQPPVRARRHPRQPPVRRLRAPRRPPGLAAAGRDPRHGPLRPGRRLRPADPARGVLRPGPVRAVRATRRGGAPAARRRSRATPARSATTTSRSSRRGSRPST